MESHTLYIKPETNRFLIYNQRNERSYDDLHLNTDRKFSNLTAESSNHDDQQSEHFLDGSKLINKSEYNGLGNYWRNELIENLENNICGVKPYKKIKNMRLRSSAYYNKISSLEHHYAYHFERLNYDVYLISGKSFPSENCPNCTELRDNGSQKKYPSCEGESFGSDSSSSERLTDNSLGNEVEIADIFNAGEEHKEINVIDPEPAPAKEISIGSQVPDTSESSSVSIQTESLSENREVYMETDVKTSIEMGAMQEFTILNDEVDTISSSELKSLENSDKTIFTSVSNDNTIVVTATENGNVHLFFVVSNNNTKNIDLDGKDSGYKEEFFKKINGNVDTLAPSGKGRNIDVYKKIVVKNADLKPAISFNFFNTLNKELGSNERDTVRSIAIVRKSIGVHTFYLLAVASTRLLALFILREGTKITLVGELAPSLGRDFLDVYLNNSGRSGYVVVVSQTSAFSYKIKYGFGDGRKSGVINVVSVALTQTFESNHHLRFSGSSSEFVATVNRENELVVLSNPKLDVVVKRKIKFEDNNGKHDATYKKTERLAANSIQISDKFVLLTVDNRVYLFLIHANKNSIYPEPNIDLGKFSLIKVAVNPGFGFVSFADFVNDSNLLIVSDDGLYIMNILTGDVFNFHFDILRKLLQISPRSQFTSDNRTRIAVLRNQHLYDALIESSGCIFCNKYEKLVNRHNLNSLLFFSASGPSLKYLLI